MFLIQAWLSVKIGNDQKPTYYCLLHGHGYQIPVSKFCHPSYMVIISHNFKALLSLLSLFHPTISNFTNLPPWNFFGLVIIFYLFIYFFREIGRNYILSITLIIITIVSNITVLVSQNIIFFGFFIPMSHGVNK